jgi:hypothetical protein
MSQQSLHRRIWTGRASLLHVATGQLEQAIDHLEWQSADSGVSEEKTGAAVLHQFVIKHNLHVTHYARCDDFLPLWLYGLRSDFSKGVAQAYFVDTGSEAMLVAWDYFPKNAPLRPPPLSPPTRSRSRRPSPATAEASGLKPV